MCTQNQAVGIMREVYQACLPIFSGNLMEGYLYGSFARGEQHPESDIDILLTVDLSPEAIGQFRRRVASVTSDLSLKHDITISVSVKSHRQFEKYAAVLPYYQNVIKEGIRYGAS